MKLPTVMPSTLSEWRLHDVTLTLGSNKNYSSCYSNRFMMPWVSEHDSKTVTKMIQCLCVLNRK